MRIPTFLVASTVAVCFVGTTFAQPPEGGRRGGMGMGMQASAGFLVGNKSVQDELKITEEQKEKWREAQKTIREKVGNIREMEPEERQAAMKEMNEATDKAVKEILTADQAKRLTEIRWQQAPGAGFASPDFQEGLKITDDQKEKLKGIMEEMGKDMREIFQESRENPREAREKIEALQKETKEKAMGVLTADQKASYEKLVGKPFELKQEMRRPGDGDGKGGKKGDKNGGGKKPKGDD